MTQTFSEYTPDKVWEWNTENGGQFANINRPIAGATHEKERPVGKHPIQLYSLATPNGVKVTVMLEELLAAKPDLVLRGVGGYGQPSLHQGLARHPLLDRVFASRPRCSPTSWRSSIPPRPRRS